MFYRLYYGLWNYMINVEVTLISSSSNMILNISTYPLQAGKYVVDKLGWVSNIMFKSGVIRGIILIQS